MSTAGESRPYAPHEIEVSWQQKWQETASFEVADDLPREQCYYVLEMFPYPSGKLHGACSELFDWRCDRPL